MTKQNSLGNRITTTKNSGKKKKNKKHKNKKMNFPSKNYNINLINNLHVKKRSSNKNKKSNPNILLNNEIKKSKKSENNNISSIRNFTKIRPIKLNNKLKISYNDFELNSFDYKTSLLNDKRTFCQYYLSLLRTKNIILS